MADTISQERSFAPPKKGRCRSALCNKVTGPITLYDILVIVLVYDLTTETSVMTIVVVKGLSLCVSFVTVHCICIFGI